MSLSPEVKKLDRVFSKYIRLRDSNRQGFGKCITCHRVLHWEKAHCGHYVNRAHMALRFHEKNCHLQCPFCNSFREGEMLEYTLAIIKKYGEKVLQELQIIRNQTTKYSAFELQALTAHYKKSVEILKTVKQ